MNDNMNPTTDRTTIIDDIIEQWFDVLTSDDLEGLAAEALRKRYDKWTDSDLIAEYMSLTEGNIPPCTLI